MLICCLAIFLKSGLFCFPENLATLLGTYSKGNKKVKERPKIYTFLCLIGAQSSVPVPLSLLLCLSQKLPFFVVISSSTFPMSFSQLTCGSHMKRQKKTSTNRQGCLSLSHLGCRKERKSLTQIDFAKKGSSVCSSQDDLLFPCLPLRSTYVS